MYINKGFFTVECSCGNRAEYVIEINGFLEYKCKKCSIEKKRGKLVKTKICYICRRLITENQRYYKNGENYCHSECVRRNFCGS